MNNGDDDDDDDDDKLDGIDGRHCAVNGAVMVNHGSDRKLYCMSRQLLQLQL